MKGATLSTHPSTGLSGIQFSNTPETFHDSERIENIDNCAVVEVRGDFLRPPHEVRLDLKYSIPLVTMVHMI